MDFFKSATRLSQKPKKEKELKVSKGQIGIFKTESKVTYVDYKIFQQDLNRSTDLTTIMYTVPVGRSFNITYAFCNIVQDDTSNVNSAIYCTVSSISRGLASATSLNSSQVGHSAVLFNPPLRLISNDTVTFQETSSIAVGVVRACFLIVVGYEEEARPPL